ncbi:putative pH-response transcription factor [Triangularia verruculosa]|uniref:PH-response transcription factor n=1 Tax=Triangularia verruculosa TaxID=2587418 RepID=A0AAN6XPR9_9PEZI|nr:putative pH-response transcription factor [Triangularia verruculosa]
MSAPFDDQLPGIARFPDTEFIRQHPDTLLPSPANIRARNHGSTHPKADDVNRPPPVRVAELGLLVKYGTQVKRTEMDTQRFIYRQLRGSVNVPEVVAWTEDNGQGFIYMTYIDAPTLADRWNGLTESERQSICRELHDIVQKWKVLEQDSEETYIGAVGKQPLNDILVKDRSDLHGPWVGDDPVQMFHEACHIELAHELPVVFAHGDLVPCNILVSEGENPTVTAIIDWAQGGWYPSYWEWCKAKWAYMPLSDMDRAAQEDWKENYLPLIINPLSETDVYHPWLYFTLSKV